MKRTSRLELNSGEGDKKRRVLPNGDGDGDATLDGQNNNVSESSNNFVSSSSSSSSSSASPNSNKLTAKTAPVVTTTALDTVVTAGATDDDAGTDADADADVNSLGYAALKKEPRQILPWEQMFQHLMDYSVANGTCNVPKRAVVQTPTRVIKLGQWLSDQRKMFTKNKIISHRLEKINELISKGLLSWGTSTKREAFDTRWNKCYASLREYGLSSGSCNVPRDFSLLIYAEGQPVTLKLGNWVHKQRSNKKKGKLDVYKHDLLQELVDQNLLIWDCRQISV